MCRIGIVGGGPGGLMTAYRLKSRLGAGCSVTLLEASDRLGGKLMTRSFDRAPVRYEAGAAEIYDYSAVGHDPLRALVDELGLATRPMAGQTVVLDGRIVRSEADLARHWGLPTLRAVRDFRDRAAASLPLDRWHPGSWRFDREHPWAARSCDELLDTVPDEAARRFLRILLHADLATEPHLTNGLNGLKNVVLDVPGYAGLHAVDGGMEAIARRMVERLAGVEILCDTRVRSLGRDPDGSWHLESTRGAQVLEHHFDVVVLALPAGQLGTVETVGEPLSSTLRAHLARFDRPGHYLRVSMLFRRPFWEGVLQGSWFTVDRFGGACVYDESARYESGGYGVLGFLLAGNDALAAMGMEEGALASEAIDSLPASLRDAASDTLLEVKVHRWCGGVSGQPGGLPVIDPVATHYPDPEELPGLLLVGDYLFDSTLNGVLESADLATELLVLHVARTVGVQLLPQPCLGQHPVPLHGLRGHVQDVGGLLQRQPREEPALHHPGRTGAGQRQTLHGLVDRGQFIGGIRGQEPLHVLEGPGRLPGAALDPLPTPGVVDQDPTHGLRGDGEEVAPIGGRQGLALR